MKKLSRKQLAALIALIATSVLLITGLVFALYRKPIESAEVAAWVQAFASVGAILAAIAIMDTQHRRLVQDSVKKDAVERANVIRAVGFFAVEVRSVIETASAAVAQGRISRTMSDFALARLRSTQEGLAGMPVWQNPLSEAQHIMIIRAACRNVIAALDAADQADQRRYISVGGVGQQSTFDAQGLTQPFLDNATAISRSYDVLKAKYSELTGETLDV